jgi:hypothetical protein
VQIGALEARKRKRINDLKGKLSGCRTSFSKEPLRKAVASVLSDYLGHEAWLISG